MSKRFTDTELWVKPWFMELSPAEKSAWFYITAHCDNVGVWTPNTKLAEFVIGDSIDWMGFASKCNGNIELLDDGKWWLADFCAYQHPDLAANPDGGNSNALKSYVRDLKRHGLHQQFIDNLGTEKAKHRSSISSSKRNYIVQRDGRVCAYCGHAVNNFEIDIDHIVPLATGGTDEVTNLVVSCRSCNNKKGILSVLDFVDKFDLNKDEVMKRISRVTGGHPDAPKAQARERVREQEKEKSGSVQKWIHSELGLPMDKARYSRLCDEYGKDVVHDYIEKIQLWEASKGESTKDYAARAEQWMKRDNIAKLHKPKICPDCGKQYIGDCCGRCGFEEGKA